MTSTGWMLLGAAWAAGAVLTLHYLWSVWRDVWAGMQGGFFAASGGLIPKQALPLCIVGVIVSVAAYAAIWPPMMTLVWWTNRRLRASRREGHEQLVADLESQGLQAVHLNPMDAPPPADDFFCCSCGGMLEGPADLLPDTFAPSRMLPRVRIIDDRASADAGPLTVPHQLCSACAPFLDKCDCASVFARPQP